MESMVMDKNFWAHKRVFLTGHTGFKGSWLSLWLHQLGADVTGYALAPPTTPNLFDVANVSQGMRSLIGDVRDAQNLERCMKIAEPEIVIHMAAQSLVRYSYDNPVETYATNIMGAVNVLDAVRKASGVRAVVNVTSDKCYENKEWLWGYRENERMGGHDPYSSSKSCAELITAAYRSSFFCADDYPKHGVAVASVRAGNVIGGGDWAADRLIPDIIRGIQSGQSLKVRSPNSVRPWQHVLEPLCGYLLLAQKLCSDGMAYAGGWNFGANDDDSKPVRWIVEQIISRWEGGGGASWELDVDSHPHEAHQLKLDCSKAKAELGWLPRWSLGDSLRLVVEWHKSYIQGHDMRNVTVRQIEDYSQS